jgi:hypothetical protein
MTIVGPIPSLNGITPMAALVNNLHGKYIFFCATDGGRSHDADLKLT